MSDDIALVSITEAGRRLDAGTTDPLALVDACLERIQRHDGVLASYLHLDAGAARETARAAARRMAREGRKGPLDGIAVAVKDVFDTHDMPTTGNSRLLAGRRPAIDATAVARLREAGAILIGKTAAWEFAMGGTSLALPWPPARNPWDIRRDPGGSSTGSAVALAAGFAFGSLGTDTGGSIREPAAWCGLAGLKPTHGRVPLDATLAASFSLDHAGPMARSSEDCALLLDALAGGGDRAFASGLARGVGGLKIGMVDLGPHRDDLPPDIAQVWETARGALEKAGANFGVVRLPPLDLFSAVVTVLASVEGFVLHRDHLATAPELYDPLTRQRIVAGEAIPASAYVDALATRQSLRREVATAFEGFDLLLMPMTYGAAPPLGGFDSHGGHPSLGRPWNVTGAPALSVRAGFDRAGFPLAVQLVGPPGADALVLAAGHALDLALGIGGIWPDLALTTRASAAPPAIAQPDPAALAAAVQASLERIRGAGTRPGATLGRSSL